MIVTSNKINNINQDIFINDSDFSNFDKNNSKIDNNKSISLTEKSPAYKFCKNIKEINNQNEDGFTPIYSAILSNDITALNELLKLGANPNIKNFSGETPLYLSVTKKNLDAFIILLQYDADCNILTKKGNTPLHEAIIKNEENMIQILLRNKANPNIKNISIGQTATHLAVINRLEEDILKLFKESNADIFNIKDKFNKSAFDYAKENNDEYYMHLLLKIFKDNKNNYDTVNNKYIDKPMQTWNEKKISNHIKEIQSFNKIKLNYDDSSYYKENNLVNNTDRNKYKNKLKDNSNTKNCFSNSKDKNKYNNNLDLSNNQKKISDFTSESNKNEIKFDDFSSFNSPININKDKDMNSSDNKNIYTHGRAIISSDLCSNNIQIKELNNSFENSKNSSKEILDDEINNIDIYSYKPDLDDKKNNSENNLNENNNININLNNNFAECENSNNNISNNIGYNQSNNKNFSYKTNKSNNPYETNSMCTNRKIIKNIIDDTVKKIVIKTISSINDDDNASNAGLFSKDSERNINSNSINEDNKIKQTEPIQIKEQINIKNNENKTNNNYIIETNTNNFEDNTVNLYENGTTSFQFYKNNGQTNDNNIMINNANINDKKSINISNINEEININSINTNKTNEYIDDNNINKNQTINLNNIDYLENNLENNIINEIKKNNLNMDTNSIYNNCNNNNDKEKDNIFFNSTNSHIFSELQMNSNNNIDLTYSRNQQSEESNIKNSQENILNEYNNRNHDKIYNKSNLDINIIEPNDINEEKSDFDYDNYDNSKINKSIYKNNYLNINNTYGNSVQGSDFSINNKNDNNDHKKKISNGKVSNNINQSQNNHSRDMSTSIVLKKSKSFIDSTQKKNNFNKSLYSPSELENINEKNTNKNINNNTNYNNQVYKKHHRQLSYHLNYKSGINNNKDKEYQPSSNNLIIINDNNSKENINNNENNKNNIINNKNEMIYYNKNNMINSLNKSSNKNNSIQKKKTTSNGNIISNNNINENSTKKNLIKNNSYKNINIDTFQPPIETTNKQVSVSPINKTNTSILNNHNNSTAIHNYISNNNNNETNININTNNFNKKNKISSVLNTINNTTISTINRQSKNNNIKHIPINQNRNSNNKYNINNYEDNNFLEEEEEDYCDSDRLKNIPTRILMRLRDWLISCDLLCYYNLFIAKNMYDIDSYIRDIQEGIITISYKNLEKIGIKKPGHIFRILIKLELDSGIIDINLFNYILEMINYNSYTTTTFALTSSISDINCCGMNICTNNKNEKNQNKRNGEIYYNDLSSFLRSYHLYKFKGNFTYNGFDKIEFILIQLFSKYNFNRQILTDCLHIYVEKDKIKLLKKLYMAKADIAEKFGIEYDEEELDKIIFHKKNNIKNNGNKIYDSNSQKKNYYSCNNINSNSNSSLGKSSSDSDKNNNFNEEHNYCNIY